MKKLLEIRNVTKRFGNIIAVDNVSLEIAESEFFALLGPSGCGKTTLMRIIAGFEVPDTGQILIGGRDIADVPAYERPVNMMFQSYALFPHMSVEKNVAFGLKQMGMRKPGIAERVTEMLRLVQLDGLNARMPAQLSGGQRQRVALARALARQPSLLLLDEPLAALDRKLREETQFELMHVQRQLGTSFMLVTHDQDEAMAMASRIAIMRSGRIEQAGSPREIYDTPDSRFVAGFVGDINLFECEVDDDGRSGAAQALRWRETEHVFRAPDDVALKRGAKVALAVRPESIQLSAVGDGGPNCVQGHIEEVVFRGDASLVRVRLISGFVLRAAIAQSTDSPLSFKRGDHVQASFSPNSGRVLMS